MYHVLLLAVSISIILAAALTRAVF